MTVLTHAAAAPLTGGLSPVSLGLALADWVRTHVSPGRQPELAALATQLTRDACSANGDASDAGLADDDPRFGTRWAQWPSARFVTAGATPRYFGRRPPACRA
ncbi:MAG: poly-beta-hydroxybutyrate polymerase N-terminal domain-containing protein [Rhodoferax sp.]|nr:poly-beta-hydroxybutyrate polymerase N-terminal domain-containing protein [Rhodoferax sp.]